MTIDVYSCLIYFQICLYFLAGVDSYTMLTLGVANFNNWLHVGYNICYNPGKYAYNPCNWKLSGCYVGRSNTNQVITGCAVTLLVT